MAELEDCLAMDRDPEVTRYVAGPWTDPAAHRRFVEARISTAYPKGLGYWTVRGRTPEAPFLGWVLLIPLDGEGPEVEIGWRFNRTAWGRGYATEAAAPVLAHARDMLGIAVVADIDPDNVASMRVAEKIGLRRIGPDGHDAIRYAG
ncbi:GNAT family N-acetyltransferase [Inquilinus limosus]|uniref:GNAT family N-acetyltransferase n=2 Tax=Inquilinus limosus TaxID=171674 RepID=A0A211Z6H4_9PROT|nr:GNAT family N-acetyltransferase [Inquilinus limosus]